MIAKTTFFRGFSILAAVLALLAFPFDASHSGTIVVKPGQFDHFTVQMPERTIAGENFVIKVQAYDSNKNLITNFSETGKEFRIEVTGSATTQPTALGASSFSGGVANILVNDKKAEKIVFSIRESGGTVPVVSRELQVIPNKLDHFLLQYSSTITAGQPFEVKVVAKDLYENTVSDLDVGRNIKVLSTGTSSVKMSGASTVDFRNGSAVVSLVAEKTGDVVVEIQEMSTGSSGRTKSLEVLPGALSVFKMQAPKRAVAGEPFEVLIAAYDAFDNLVTTYASSGSGVRLSATGGSKIEPIEVGPADFKNGQAVVRTIYEKAEPIQIIARENNRTQTGKTGDIEVVNAEPSHFVVVTPESALSGQRFRLKIEAYDRYNNAVKNFNLVGGDVMLSTSGTGALTPSRVPAAEFQNGVAMVDVMYDKAESFQISAVMSRDRQPGRMTMKQAEAPEKPAIREHRAEAAERPRPQPAVSPKPERSEAEPAKRVEKTKAAAPAPAAAKKIAKEAPAETKVGEKRTEPPKAAVAKAEAPKPAPAKAEPKPEKREPAVQQRKEEKPAEEPKKVASLEPTRQSEKKLKPEKGGIYSVSNVSIIEAKEKSMLVINVTNPNGHLEYTDEIESKYGKEWLKLRMKPAVNAAGKNFKFQSYFIGDVLIEEDKAGQNSVSVLIELVPAGLTYDIARVKNNLIITFAKP